MHLLTGYAKPVKALAVSLDGSRLFSAAQGQSLIWEWDLLTREFKQKLPSAHSKPFESLAVTPDGKWLVGGETHRGVVVWPLAGGEPRRFGESGDDTTGFGTTVSIDSTSTQVATPWHNWRERAMGVMLWDLRTGKKIKAVRGHTERVRAAAFCPGTTLLAAADRHVGIWDYESNVLRHVLIHSAVPQTIAFRPDGDVLATAAGRSIFLWDVAKGVLVRTLAGQGGRTVLAYSPDSKYLASAGPSGILVLLDARTYELVGQRHLEIGKIGALTWSRDSQTLFVGGAKPIAVCELGELLVKEGAKPKTRGEPLSLAGHTRQVTTLSYSPDGRTLASWDEIRVCLWDMSGGAGQAKLTAGARADHYHGSGGQITCSPDGGRVATGGQIADGTTGTTVRDFPHDVRHVAFTSAGNLIVVQDASRQGRLRAVRLSLHNATTDEILFQKEVEEDSYSSFLRTLTFGENDQRVYLIIGGRTVTCWTPHTGEVVALIHQNNAKVGALAVRADERLVATTGAKNVYVWSLPDGKKQLELKHPLTCTGAEFVHDGRLITSSYDGVVRVWDLSGGAEMHAFDLGMGRVYSLAVSPDGMTFAAAVHKGNRIVLMDVPE
jgi:WD40 repeat protein